MIEIQAPNEIPTNKRPMIFAAGSIEMGKAEDWQAKLKQALEGYEGVILNPRRDFWNQNWAQRMSDPNFSQQVNWELDGLKASSIIVFYFDPKTQSPISLYELGRFSESGKILVCCPDGFWKKGNVEIGCVRDNIPLFNSFDELIEALIKILNKI